jgi:hypothetical protein
MARGDREPLEVFVVEHLGLLAEPDERVGLVLHLGVYLRVVISGIERAWVRT